MAMAVPAAISVGGLIAGKFAGDSARKTATRLTPEEAGYYRAQTGLADQLKTQGGEMFRTGMPAVGQGLSYYQTLLNGSRGAMTQAVAPETAAISDVYRGAENALVRSGVTGAARDEQRGELNRERAGRIAGLIGGVRPRAADAATGTGLSLASGATGAGMGAGHLYSGLIGAGTRNRELGNAAAYDASSSIGAIVADLVKGAQGKGGKASA
jgi:hypothetical protein